MNYLNGGLEFANAYYVLGMKKKADEIVNAMWKNYGQYMNWYLSLKQSRFTASQRDCMYNLYIMQQIVDMIAPYDKAAADKKTVELNHLMSTYQSRGGSLGMEQ